MKFSLPSLTHIQENTRRVWSRFPIPLTVATALSIFLLLLNHDVFPSRDSDTAFKIIFSGLLLIPLSIGIQIRREVTQLGDPLYWTLHLLSLCLVAYLFTLIDPDMGESRALQYALCFAGAHLIACSFPFWGTGLALPFWQYNRIMLLRILLSAFFTMFLSGGLTLALLALQHLLGVNVREKLYLDLAIVLGGLFNTWFFLAGMPADVRGTGEESIYPKPLKIFSEYVLIPLVVIYLVILYLYAGKVLILRQWPLTWMGNLVMGFSISGILAMLLVWPVRDQRENPWIYYFSRWYLPSLIPLTLLLLVTIGRQISEYGITPNRYILALMTTWVLAVSVYYVIRGLRNILPIPLSLMLVCFFGALGGPLNLIQVSLRNQSTRMEAILNQYDALDENGYFTRPGRPIPDSAKAQILSRLDFLDRNDDSTWVVRYSPPALTDSLKREGFSLNNGYTWKDALMGIIGGPPDYDKEYDESGVHTEFRHLYTVGGGIPVAGFELLQDISFSDNSIYDQTAPETIQVIGDPFPIQMQYDCKRRTLIVDEPAGGRTEMALADSLRLWAGRSSEQSGDEAQFPMVLEANGWNYRIRLYFTSLTLAQHPTKGIRIQDAAGKLMLQRLDSKP